MSRLATFQEVSNKIKNLKRANASVRSKLISIDIFNDYKKLYAEYHDLKAIVREAEKSVDYLLATLPKN